MTDVRTNTLARLRGGIERIEAHADTARLDRVALGHAEADATLQGGLVRGTLHEVFALETRQVGAATGFVAGIAQRLTAGRPLLWIRQDFVAREAGALAMSGLAELGLDPRRIVLVQAADAEMALRVGADALACDALGAVVLDLWGEVRQFDLVASRKYTLAAQTSGVSCVMLRTSALPAISTAETRWVVQAARSPPSAPWEAWGAPILDTQLIRNRHGQTGRWIMEWKCDECLFRETAHSQPVAAAPADRPHQAPALLELRGTRRGQRSA
ncbi:ImuA family protein [Tardiphaga robiniae]|uniref:DNA repair protein n=1 Tax=Tardiphaga robiniae TaxID=943830 RepID=A0A161QXF9_9BRAD|nr:DNA repair protein [Tardiphaga robiniae]KZD20561.1 DNA repair protein [Tardiphaga robiniae]